jgi:hypothetical protein
MPAGDGHGDVGDVGRAVAECTNTPVTPTIRSASLLDRTSVAPTCGNTGEPKGSRRLAIGPDHGDRRCAVHSAVVAELAKTVISPAVRESSEIKSTRVKLTGGNRSEPLATDGGEQRLFTAATTAVADLPVLRKSPTIDELLRAHAAAVCAAGTDHPKIDIGRLGAFRFEGARNPFSNTIVEA